jgi:CRP-like cAMP-binding protein
MATLIANQANKSTLEHNRILDALPEQERARIMPRLELLPLKIKDYQLHQGELIRYCYFPLSGTVSLTQPMNNGDSAEVGLVGREGVVGLPAYFGEDIADNDAFVQLPGAALRISREDFRDLVAENPNLARMMARYANSQLSISTHVVACNALHNAEQRLARWLLSVRDRADSDLLTLTHEFLSLMLGTRRATVTVTVGVLENAGLVELGRGSIRILNRKKLHETSCECYDRVHAYIERIFAA